MNLSIEPYGSSITALAAIAVLMFVQLLIADVFGITKKRAPGTSVTEAHSSSLFRVTRTVANTNESIAIFVCALLYCVLSGASATFTAYSAWAFVGLRLLYALCYYANLQTLRSISFGLSLVSLAALIGVGVLA